MPLKFLRYYGSEGPRDMVVVDGLPYYRSTGKNSSFPGKWLPFYGAREKDTSPSQIVFSKNRGELRFDLSKKDKFLRGVFKKRLFSVGWLIKFPSKFFVSDIPRLAKVPISTRIYSKKDLITSERLSLGDGQSVSDDKTLLALGLSPSEIKETKTPLNLEAIPDLIIFRSHPEELNAWLISQGAETIKPSMQSLILLIGKFIDCIKNTEWEKLEKLESTIPKDIKDRIDIFLSEQKPYSQMPNLLFSPSRLQGREKKEQSVQAETENLRDIKAGHI